MAAVPLVTIGALAALACWLNRVARADDPARAA